MAAVASSSGLFPYVVAIGKVINTYCPEYNVTVSESDGNVDNTKRLRAGEVKIANSISNTDYESYTGTGTAASVVIHAAFDALGIHPDYFEAGQADAADAYANRQIVGAVKTGPTPDSYVMQLNSSRPVKMLSISDEDMAKILAAIPSCKSAVVTAGSYEFMPDYDAQCVSTYQGIQVSMDFSQEQGYQFIKAMWEDGKEIWQNAYPIGANNDVLEMTLQAAATPLHAGTVQYLVEKGYGFWDRVVKVLSFALILFQLYTTWRGPYSDIIQRSVHLSFVLTLLFLLKPAFKHKDGREETSVPWYDVIFALVSIASCWYLVYITDDILYDPLKWVSRFDRFAAVALVALILEASRRSVGWTFPILGLAFLFYAFQGELFPGIWGHQNFSFNLAWRSTWSPCATASRAATKSSPSRWAITR